MSEATTTRDHDEIRKWVEARNGVPASVKGTEAEDDGAGVLRFDFPGGAGEDELTHIEWDEWFEKFDEKGLSLLYQDTTADGEQSTFFKLVND
ncbi:hypothetical protein [Brevibacterium renqingii]|uniref:hypothetical protein n=1 Tax=Brevibacterium renqingii TaxID=2776916 RepID=UPI001ADF1108|nr:hypothetical protein [Brevibacterium renqingii]